MLYTPFRYDYVGSFLRPEWLLEARSQRAAGKLGADELKELEDKAITELIGKLKAIGYHVITDGEFRRNSWHLDFMWGFNGVSHRPTKMGLRFHDEAAMLDDTYLSDQNACTSPHIVFWTGNSVEKARDIFWGELQKLADERYELQAVQAVGKLDAFCMAAMKNKCRILGEYRKNNLVRVELLELDKSIREYRYHSGFFFEYQMRALTDMLGFCDEKCQTISYVGNIGAEIEKAVAEAGVNGVDRIVPVGRTMDFSLAWDGYDLIRTMSRIVART